MITVSRLFPWILFVLVLNSFIFILKPARALKIFSHKSLNLAADYPVPSDEYNALYDLYAKTDGPNWRWVNVSSFSEPWNFTSGANPCSDNWQGISCNCIKLQKVCHITGLNLRAHNLSGILPSTIGNLNYLNSLTLDTNNITGTIPDSFGNFTSMRVLSMHNNNLHGTIPTSFGEMKTLISLNLYDNVLNGTLPRELFILTELQDLQLEVNYFSGSIPADIGKLKKLQILMLQLNEFTGTIPSSIGNFTDLFAFDISDNHLRGEIPDALTTLKNLTIFIAGGNFLNGTLPQDFGSMTKLKLVDFTINLLTGKIPLSVGNLSSVQGFYLNSNSFFGPFPSNFANNMTSHMYSIDMADNLLSGTFPSTISSWKLLQYFSITHNSFHATFPWNVTVFANVLDFQIGYNFFVGSVPIGKFDSSPHIVSLNVAHNLFTGRLPSCQNWTTLVYYYSYVNYFTGHIPNELENSLLLNIFEVSSNVLSGTIPTWMGYRNQLGYVNFSENHFTGPFSNLFPETTGLFPDLTQLSISYNYFTGTIPSSISDTLRLHGMFLNNNELSGPIPNIFMKLTELEVLLLQNNKFTGSFPNIGASPSLQNVDFSSNKLTGHVSNNFYENSTLVTLSIGSNCFEGSIPPDICNLPRLQVISFNGLATAGECRVPLFPSSFNFRSFLLEHKFHGGIPTCLFTMPSLTTLHLSGNALTGTIPSNGNISESLQDLSLSHNQLTGTIPNSIQERFWLNLDLSYNKLTGTLSSRFHSYDNTSCSLSLDINRLSGSIPINLLHATDINILEGNIFGCDPNHNNLPKHDERAADYSCGSDIVDYTLYSWLSVTVVVLLIASVGYYYYRTDASNRTSELSESNIDRGKTLLAFVIRLIVWRRELQRLETNVDSSIKEVPVFLSKVRKLALLFGGIIIFIYMPIYSGLGVFYRQYSEEYAWKISALLLSGQKVAVILALFFFLLVLLVIFLITKSFHYSDLNIFRLTSSFSMPFRNSTSSSLSPENSIANSRPQTECHQPGKSSLFSSATKPEDKQKSPKTSFTAYFIIGIMDFVFMLVVDIVYVYVIITYETAIVILSEIMLALVKTVLNNMIIWWIIPFVKRKLFDVYYDKQYPEEFVSFTRMDLSFVTIVILLNNIVFPIIAVFVVSPDCIYTAIFQPSNVSSSYTYTICDRYAGHVFVDYCFNYQTLTEYSAYSPPFIYNYQCASTIIINYVSVFIIMYTAEGILLPFLKLILKFIDEVDEVEEYKFSTSRDSSSLHQQPSENLPVKSLWHRESTMKIQNRLSSFLLPMNLKSLSTKSQHIEEEFTDHVLFDKNRLSVRMNSYLVVMMSFGALFPPLALIICMTIFTVTIYEEIVIGRLLYESERLGYVWYRKQLERDCYGVSDSLKYTLWSLVPVSSIFFAYIIFDTWGDEAGWRVAIVPALLMAIVPTTLLVLLKYYPILLVSLKKNGNRFPFAFFTGENHKSQVSEPELISKNSASRPSEIEVPQILAKNETSEVVNPIQNSGTILSNEEV